MPENISTLADSYIDEERESVFTTFRKYSSPPFEVWALGITIVIGGAYFSWNDGLVSGFGTFFIASILIGSAYTCLILSTSEITSALPFAGGAYGLARCTVGFFAGFMIGFTEAFQYMIYVSLSTLALVSMITDALNISSNFQPCLSLLFYFIYASVHIRGGNTFWKFNTLLGVVSLAILIVFCIGALRWVDFKSNVVHNQPLFVNGIFGFMHILPLPAWFFVGVESLSFAADMVHQDDPKIVVPKGSVSCVLTLLLMSICVLFVCSSLPPGVQVIAKEHVPLNTGFSLIFNCSSRCATLLSLPATFATAYGFVFSFGKLLHALATSKLLPDIFSRTAQPQATPFAAIILGSAISYIVCLLVFFFPQSNKYLFNLCITDAFVSYCTQCIGFLCMRTKFGRLPRLFNSPVGVFGALYAFFIFLFGIISVIGFQEDNHVAFISALFIWAAFSLYYFLYAKYRQTFSVEEQKILLVAHVINHNLRGNARRRAIAKKKQAQSSGASSKNPSRNTDSTVRPSLDIFRFSFSDHIFLCGKGLKIFHHSKVLPGFDVIAKSKPSTPQCINHSRKSSNAAGIILKPAILKRRVSALFVAVRPKFKSQAFSSNAGEEKQSDMEAK